MCYIRKSCNIVSKKTIKRCFNHTWRQKCKQLLFACDDNEDYEEEEDNNVPLFELTQKLLNAVCATQDKLIYAVIYN